MESVEALGVRFLDFRNILNDRLRVVDKTCEAAAQRAKAELLHVCDFFLFGGCYFVPRASELPVQIRIAADLFSELILVLLLFGDDALVQQAIVLAIFGLDRVLEAKPQAGGLAFLLRAQLSVSFEDVDAAIQGLERLRIAVVTFGFYLGHCEQSIGGTGIA